MQGEREGEMTEREGLRGGRREKRDGRRERGEKLGGSENGKILRARFARRLAEGDKEREGAEVGGGIGRAYPLSTLIV